MDQGNKGEGGRENLGIRQRCSLGEVSTSQLPPLDDEDGLYLKVLLGF